MAKNLPKSVLHFRSFCFAYKPQGSYSLEFLSSNFPDMEKVWKTEIKSGKLQQPGFIRNYFFSFW